MKLKDGECSSRGEVIIRAVTEEKENVETRRPTNSALKKKEKTKHHLERNTERQHNEYNTVILYHVSVPICFPFHFLICAISVLVTIPHHQNQVNYNQFSFNGW